MGADRISVILLAAALLLAGCDGQRTDLPTSPVFATKKAGCNTTTIQQLVNNEFTGSTRLAVNKLVDDLGRYRSAGDSSNATYLGYKVLDSIARVGRAQGTPAAGSQLAVEVLGCMTTGGATIPESFTLSLESKGAFAVRGWPAGDATVNAAPVVSADGAWQLQPPGSATWNEITTLTVANLADTVATLFLAYGRPSSSTGFSNDVLTSTVFDWATIPAATFSPGVLVAQCTEPAGYIQHDVIASAEILGYVAVSCGATSRAAERRRASFAERLLRLFQPEPLQASVLAIGSAGKRSTLSPFGKIDPVWIDLQFATQPSKSGNSINRYFSPTATVTAESKGGTGIGNNVFVWLEAFNNSGVFVKVCNNWAYTDAAGVASFPKAYVNKAGGYTLVAKASTMQGVPALPLKAPATSSLFNVKNSSVAPPDDGCSGVNVYVSGPLPPAP
jgi:hypothetical protein